MVFKQGYSIEELRNKKTLTILGVESSCDETAAAVVVNGTDVKSNVIATQIEIHKRFGGVVPEIASRNHTLAIRTVVEEALKQANLTLDDIDAYAVTYGAGLVGALLVGVSFTKALAYAEQKPLIAVNHIQGHIAANYIAHNDLTPPYLCLVVSGGHTALVMVKDYTDLEIIGETTDDACGEAFDKVARVLGLPYPGGPQIEELAKSGRVTIELPHAFKNDKQHYNFSYSGLKTAVINYVHNAEERGDEINKANVAASFQAAAVGVLADATERAVKDLGVDKIVVAGGVSSNAYLRETFEKRFNKVYFPPIKLCTDNAAMIAAGAYFKLKSGAEPAPLTLNAEPGLKLYQ